MNKLPIPKEESISSLIYIIRGEKVMFDFDLATLYSVETRTLKPSCKKETLRDFLTILCLF